MAGSLRGTVCSLNVSPGGVPKWPVPIVLIDEHGIVGDYQSDRVNHGGPERALCLYALDRIEGLAAEGHDVEVGSTGENVTLEGLDWEAMTPGRRVRLGEQVLIEITSYTPPCRTNARWFLDEDFGRISQRAYPGWSRVYARVVEGGIFEVGAEVEILSTLTGSDGQ